MPMDLSALPKWKQKPPKGGKDLAGKGKGDKGKGKGQGSKPHDPHKTQGSQGGGQGQGKGKEVVWWYCEKKGHTKAECRKSKQTTRRKMVKAMAVSPANLMRQAPLRRSPSQCLQAQPYLRSATTWRR